MGLKIKYKHFLVPKTHDFLHVLLTTFALTTCLCVQLLLKADKNFILCYSNMAIADSSLCLLSQNNSCRFTHTNTDIFAICGVNYNFSSLINLSLALIKFGECNA